MTRSDDRPRQLLRVLLVALAAPGAALAHHSISGVYDSGRQITIDGRVVEFQFVNPHPVLIVAASRAEAGEGPWRLEMDNRYELADIGVTALPQPRRATLPRSRLDED